MNRKIHYLLMFFAVLCMNSMYGQNKTISGTVTESESGVPLPGVNVVEKGTNNGTSTDFDGNFTISVSGSNAILVFTSLGYTTKEVPAGNQSTLNVSMSEDAEQLGEVVVTALGVKRNTKALGYSVTQVKGEEMNTVKQTNAINALQGKIAGVQISGNAAGAKGSTRVIIRGNSSLTGNNQPLYVIDGITINNSNLGSAGVWGGADSGDGISALNPDEVESISVLKGGAAAALYGSRASNGVIIITTKKGRKESSLDYDFQMGFGEIRDRVNVFDGDAFRNLVAQKQPSMVGLLGTANTNWQDEIYQKSVSTQHNLTARGQIFGAIPTRLSVGFSGIEGNILTSQFDRATFSLSMNPSFFDNHFKISLNYNRAFEDNRFADSGQVRSALRYDPTQPVYDSTSPFGGFYQHLTRTPDGVLVDNGTRNPVASLLQNNNTSIVFRHYGNLKLEYNFHFLPELTVTTNAGFDKSTAEGRGSSPLNSPANFTDLFIGYDSGYTNEVLNESFDTYFTYVNTFDKLKTDVMAGYSYQSFDSSGNSTGNIRNPNDTGATSFVSTPVVLVGFLARANLTYNEKYLLTLNYRRDGTSRFGPENRWGDFGGAALAWRISDEEFLKNSKVISELKLRASYGINGQQEGIAGDLYLDRYRFGNQGSGYLFGGIPIQSTIPSERSNLKWEKTATVEFGIDYGLFDNKFTGSINAFQKNSTDLLSDAPVADGSNFTNRVLQNVGDLQVNGLEFTVNADIIKNEDLNWNINFNATYLDREIKELALNQDITTGGIAGGTGNFVQLYREGFAPNSF